MPNIKNIMNINGFKKALRRFAKVGITQKWYSVNMSLSKLTGQEQACSWINRLVARLARWVSPCRKWPNTHDYGFWWSHGCVKPFSRLGKRNNWSSQSFTWLTLDLVWKYILHVKKHFPLVKKYIQRFLDMCREKRLRCQKFISWPVFSARSTFKIQ